MNYLSGWFVFDFAVAMPFDLLGLAVGWPEGAIRLLPLALHELLLSTCGV